MTSKCNVVSRVRAWKRKRTLGKNKGNLSRVWPLVNNVSMLAR